MSLFVVGAPLGALVLLLGLVVLVAHLLKARRRRVVVSSVALFRGGSRAVSGGKPFSRPERWLSLLLHLLAVVAVALAAMDLGRRGERPPRGTMVVVDATASMATRRTSGSTRFAGAVEAARRAIEGLPTGVPVGLVVLDRDARLLAPMGTSRAEVVRLLDAATVTATEGKVGDAIALAVEQSDAGDHDVLVFGDTPVVAAPSLQFHDVFERAENAAIVDPVASVKSSPDGALRGIVDARVFWFGAAAREVTVTLRQRNASDVLAETKVTVAPGDGVPVRLAFDAAPGDLGKGLIASVRADGDALDLDDAAFAILPQVAGPDVVFASPGGKTAPDLVRAFASAEGVRVVETTVDALMADPALAPETLVVVSGACPARLPGGSFLIVDPPAGACAGAVVGENDPAPESVAYWDVDDPRLAFLDLGDEAFRDVRSVSPGDGGARPLVSGPKRGIFFDVSREGRVGTLLVFPLEKQPMLGRAPLVVFARNLVEIERRHATRALRTQSPFTIRAPRGIAQATITTPPVRVVGIERGEVRVDDVLLPGFVDLSFGEGRTSRVVAVNGAGVTESDTMRLPEAALPLATRPEVAARAATRSLTAWFAALALLLLLLDVFLERERSGLGDWPTRLRERAVLVVAGAMAFASAVIAARRGGDVGWLDVERPALLFVAPLAIGLLFVARRRLGGKTRAVLADVVGSAAVILLAGAIAGVGPPAPRTAATVIVVDRSASARNDPARLAGLVREVRKAVTPTRQGERLGVVGFAEKATMEEVVRGIDEHPTTSPAALDGFDTDIGAGIRLALAATASTPGARIVLLSDGGETSGDAAVAARVAASRQVPIDVVVVPHRAGPNVSVRGLVGPSVVAAREPLQLSVFVSSSTEATGVVRLFRGNDRISEAKLRVVPGDDVVRFTDVPDRGGLLEYRVEVVLDDPARDAIREDDVASRFVRVVAQRSALVVEGDRGQSTFVSEALRRAGFVVSTREGAQVSLGRDDVFGHDLVVLSDVPASAFAQGTIQDVADHVRALGGGLLLLGGDRSLGPGGYGRTAIEEVSPVTFDARAKERRARLSELIVIDSSGSMRTPAGGTTKLALANEAAIRAGELLDGLDLLGVTHVDSAPSRTVPLAKLSEIPDLAQRVRAVEVGGGGIAVVVALQSAYGDLKASTTELRHVLLLADGSDAHDAPDALALTTAAKAAGISTSVVALGEGIDVPALERLSTAGGGRFHLIEDAARLPAVFAEETIQAARASIVEKSFVPARGPAGDVVRGIVVEDAPALEGYVVTSPRPGVDVDLLGPDGDPLLVRGRAGAGQVAVFTSDFKARWGRAWTRWPAASQLLSQIADAIARRDADGALATFLSFDGDTLVIEADVDVDPAAADGPSPVATVLGPDGVLAELRLEPRALGRYSASVPATSVGRYLVTVRDPRGASPSTTSGILRGRATELDAPSRGQVVLERVAAESGGRVFSATDVERGLFTPSRVRGRAASQVGEVHTPGALLAVAALVFVAWILLRRIDLPQRRVVATPVAAPPNLARLAERRRHRETEREAPPATPLRASTAAAPPSRAAAPSVAPDENVPAPPAEDAPRTTIASLAEKKRARRGRP